MIPLKDRNPSFSFPAVTILIIAINALVFIYQFTLGPRGEQQFVFTFGLIPARLGLAFTSPQTTFGDAYFPLLTSMFLHGGILHIAGNMLYLWVFGDNIEDRFGHIAYLFFYVGAGLAAGLLHALTNAGSTVPTIGASGAVAGVLGAYFVLYPRTRVLTLIPVIVFFFTVELPALVLLGLWFLMQFASGIAEYGREVGGGIAWWAHIGGFVFGMLMAKVIPARRGFYNHYRRY